MCLIISSPENAQIREAVLRDAFVSNHDGWGLMYHLPEENRVHVERGFELPALIEAVNEAQSQPRHILVHMRMATHGVVSLENTHPFELGTSGIYMMHNGVIPGYHDAVKSDTRLFCEKITNLAETAPNALHDDYVKEWLGGVVRSKLAFMTPTGAIDYIGEVDQWIEFEGNYMSNTYAWTLWRGAGGYDDYGWGWNYYGGFYERKTKKPLVDEKEFDAWYEERYKQYCLEEGLKESAVVSKSEPAQGYIEIFHADGLIGLAQEDMKECYFYEDVNTSKSESESTESIQL